MPHLVLASGSPRRQAFLAALGMQFRIDAADVDESALPSETPDMLVLRLSESKARAVATRHRNAVVLAADTVVVLDGKILGKPADSTDATRMLQALRGRMHEVYTAVSLACSPALHASAASDLTVKSGALDCPVDAIEAEARLCRSRVWMRDYRDAEIQAYVATGDPLDKAGAYAIQHPAFAPVARWEGCYAGIMGLPLGMAGALMRRAGVAVPADIVDVCELSSGPNACCLRRLPDQC
jgi:septum formation protein